MSHTEREIFAPSKDFYDSSLKFNSTAIKIHMTIATLHEPLLIRYSVIKMKDYESENVFPEKG